MTVKPTRSFCLARHFLGSSICSARSRYSAATRRSTVLNSSPSALAARLSCAAAQRKYRLDLSVSSAMARACSDVTGNHYAGIAVICPVLVRALLTHHIRSGRVKSRGRSGSLCSTADEPATGEASPDDDDAD